jgi:hypothetical protein
LNAELDRSYDPAVSRTASVEAAGAALQPLWSRVVAALEAVPEWLWVGALVGVSTLVRLALATSYPAPWIFPDSLVYSEFAKSFSETGHFALREVQGRAGFGVVYPILLSPAYALFNSVPAAFAMMKAINSILMSLAAVPTYLLARRFVGRWLALTAALLAVAVPGLAYTATIMTENAFYPVFIFWCWATVRALETPTVRRQLGALAFLAIAFLTRPQAVVLVPSLVTAVVLVTVLDIWSPGKPPSLRALVRSALRYLIIWVGLGSTAALYLGYELAVRGIGIHEAVLGADSFVSTQYSASSVGHWLLYHVAELDFSLAVLPFAALLLVIFAGLRPREPSRELRIFAAIALSAGFWLLLGVAVFVSTPLGLRILERSTFYLDPLFMIALVACIGRGFIWTRRTAAAAAAAVAVGVVGMVPYASFLGSGTPNDAFGLLPLMSVLDRHLISVTQLQSAVIAGATLAGVVFLLMPRRFGIALAGLTLLAFSLANGPVHRRTSLAAQDSRHGGVQAPRDWIDRAVGTAPQVTALWSSRAAYVTLWDNEFFNRSVGEVYNFFGPPDGLPQKTAVVQPTGQVTYLNRPVRAKYVLADPSVLVAGKPVARDVGLGMTVYRVKGPIVVRGQLEGTYPDRWSGSGAIFTAYNCTGGTVTVRLTSDPLSHPFKQTITASVGKKTYTKVVRPRQFNVPFSVPVVPVDHLCRVQYGISPVAIPDQTIHNGDTRPLGIRFVGAVYRP